MALHDVNLTLVETVDDAMKLKAWLGERRPVLGVDTETGGLDWWKNPLRLVQVGDSQHGWAIPYPMWGGLAKEVLEAYDGLMVMHNAKFDLHFLETNGIRLDRSRVHDTMFMAHLDDNDSSIALKNLSVRYVDSRANALQHQLQEAIHKNKWNWGTIPTEYPLYWMYGALDPVLTARMFDFFVPRISQWRESYDLEISAMQVLVDAERRGVQIDRTYCEYAMLGMNARVDELQEELKVKYGVTSPGSAKQVEKVLEEHGVVFTRFTKKGAPVLDEDVLGAINLPVAQLILEYRHLKKIANTYLANFLDWSDENDRLHPSIHTLGARTGRMSVGRPSLQNLERSSDVRDAFVPRGGNELLLIDYDQIEMRIFAHYAGSQALQDAFNPNNDIDGFTAMARDILQDPHLQKGDPRRQTTKNAGYAKIYGAGTPKFAETAGINLPAAIEFMAAFDRTYPEADSFITHLTAIAGERSREGNPYVETWYGRKLQIHDERKLYKLVNYLIQGGAAQVLKEKIVQLDLAGLSDYFILPIHDELMFDVPLEEVEEYTREVIPVMEDHENFDVPLTVEAKTARRWGEHYPRGAYTATKISEAFDEQD